MIEGESATGSAPPTKGAGTERLDMRGWSPDEIRQNTRDAIATANRRIDRALEGDPLTFAALFGALDDAARIVWAVYGQGAFLRSVAPQEAVREAAEAANEQIEKWRAALAQREDLAAAIARFVTTTDLATLDADEAAFVRQWQTDVRLAGAGLPPKTREEVRGLVDRLIELASAFNSNLLDIAHMELTADELEGVPDAVTATLQPGSTPGTYDVPVNEAVFDSVIERARRRGVRERVNRVRLNRGLPANREILDEAVAVRRRLARLLGYRSWHELRIESLAATDTAMIERFIDDMAVRLEPFARAEREAMRRLLLAEPGAPPDLVVEDWDLRYADAAQRAAAGADPAELEPYLEFEEVVRGLAGLSEAVFGVRLIEHAERTGWHPDVRAFDLEDRDSGQTLARMFFDPYVREGKAGNPFAELLEPAVLGPSGLGRPATLALMTSAPEPGLGPSLIGSTDVDTLFHEFGHVLDFGLARDRFALHRGETWIRSDWVEGPSLFLGGWGVHPAVLGTFGRHHITGEPIPAGILEPLQRLESLNLARRMVRWLSMAREDVLLHGEEPLTIDEASRRAWPLRGVPFLEGTCGAAAYPHLLAGYDGAVYGWVWAKVLVAELMARFERDGMTSPAVGMAYRQAILEAPWTQDPLEGLTAFLGRPWSTDTFFERIEGD